MGDIVGGLRDIVDFLLLGVMGSAVLAYAFIWIHPIKEWLDNYYGEVKGFLFRSGRVFPSGDAGRWSRVGAVLGLLFLAGTVTNVVGYWLVQPAHDEDLACFYWYLPGQDAPSVEKVEHDRCASSFPLREWQLLTKQIWPWGRVESPYDKQTYAAVLRDEASWRTLAAESAQDELHGIIKQIRLSRGAVVCSLGIVVLALFKTLSAGFVWLSIHLFPGKFYLRLYWTFIDPPRRYVRDWLRDAVMRPASDPLRKVRGKKHVCRKTLRKIWVYFLTASVGSYLYLLAFNGWISAEREYHGLAYFGNRAAIARAKSDISGASKITGGTNIMISPEPSHP